MRKTITLLLLLVAATLSAQVDSLKNASLIGQSTRNQKVGQGFQVGFIGSSNDTCQINTKLQYLGSTPSVGKVLTSDANGFATWETPSSGVSIPQSQVSYGTGTGLTSDSLFTRDTSKRTVIAYKPDGTNRIFKLEFTDSLSYINEDGHDTTVWQPRAVLSYGLDSSSQMYSYSALQILDESKVDGSANKIVLGYQSEGGSYGMNYIVEPQFLRLKVRDSITTLKTDYDFYPNTWKMDDKTNDVKIYVNWLSAPDSGHVLSMVGDSAKWQPSSTSQADSVTIYALTPRPGTQYYCTDCSGDGITGRILAYIGAAWRRLTFED